MLCFFIQLWPRSFFRLWIFRGRDLWSAVLPLFWLCGRVPAFRAFARPFPGSQPGPSSLTASAASRRFLLRLGVVPAAGAGVIWIKWRSWRSRTDGSQPQSPGEKPCPLDSPLSLHSWRLCLAGELLSTWEFVLSPFLPSRGKPHLSMGVSLSRGSFFTPVIRFAMFSRNEAVSFFYCLASCSLSIEYHRVSNLSIGYFYFSHHIFNLVITPNKANPFLSPSAKSPGLAAKDSSPAAGRWPFGRPISGIPSWGMAAVDGLTAFALPADLLSAAVDVQCKCKKVQRGKKE